MRPKIVSTDWALQSDANIERHSTGKRFFISCKKTLSSGSCIRYEAFDFLFGFVTYRFDSNNMPGFAGSFMDQRFSPVRTAWFRNVGQ